MDVKVCVCPICGKEFCPTALWVFKREQRSKTVHFCSWSCLKKFDGDDARRINSSNSTRKYTKCFRERREIVAVRKKNIYDLRLEGLSYAEIGRIIGISGQLVRSYLYSMPEFINGMEFDSQCKEKV